MKTFVSLVIIIIIITLSQQTFEQREPTNGQFGEQIPIVAGQNQLVRFRSGLPSGTFIDIEFFTPGNSFVFSLNRSLINPSNVVLPTDARPILFLVLDFGGGVPMANGQLGYQQQSSLNNSNSELAILSMEVNSNGWNDNSQLNSDGNAVSTLFFRTNLNTTDNYFVVAERSVSARESSVAARGSKMSLALILMLISVATILPFISLITV